MQFCPWEGSILILDNDSSHGGYRFRCPACNYVSKIGEAQTLVFRTEYENKKVDDILGGESAWKNVPETEASCPHCKHNRAYYMQLQTRSADEPMTIFYKCTKCKQRWKE